jgi:S1-C subfamily serine protease
MDGATGALVTHIYPGSPAEEIGLELGDILLRIHSDEHPRPLEITLEQDYSSQWDQIWSQLNQIPAEYFDQLPTPWPSVENTFNRSLTNLGFGSEVELEYVRFGDLKRAVFEVVQGPKHFGAASRFESEDLGVTVRNVTYEVRRYFRLTEDNPGVILSKIEPGERAAVAGLKPYEIVTHVNEEPVHDVEQFEALVGGSEDVSLSVKRRDQGRVVKIRR